ncbi:hypothetical protein [Pseudomonas sp. NPDC086278]|uniref:hypothetical protein n=1 Tax=Pseudomonas sp. NPDC086278 TaxID=3390646 RepID=UPI003D022EB1
MVENLLPILRERYPEFFSSAPLREIGCLPGWLNLIDELCRTLKAHLDAHPEVPQIKVRQAKEKFGGLRFYYSGGDSACREMVAAAEQRSMSTCEVCGQTGTLGGEHWLSVRCSDHLDWSPSDEGK